MITTHRGIHLRQGSGGQAEARKKLLTAVLVILLAFPAGTAAQAQPDVWRSFVQSIAPGTEMNVRLDDGQRFRATLVGAREDAVLLQPRTRVTVPVQAVPYDAIARLEPRRNGGMGAAKAVAIGVASGAGTFFAILAILLATVSD